MVCCSFLNCHLQGGEGIRAQVLNETFERVLPCLLPQSSDGVEPSVPPPAQAPSMDCRPPAQAPPPTSSGLDDLDLLGKTLLQQALPPEAQQVRW